MRYSLAHLFLLTLIVAVCCWCHLVWRENQQLKNKERETYWNCVQQEIDKNGGFKNVHYIEFIYSRFYEAEFKIGWVDEIPRRESHYYIFKGKLYDRHADPNTSTMFSKQDDMVGLFYHKQTVDYFQERKPKRKVDRSKVRPEFQHLSDEELIQQTDDWIKKHVPGNAQPHDSLIIPAGD